MVYLGFLLKSLVVLSAVFVYNSSFILSENIQQGNIIVKINSIEVFTIEDIKNILKNLKPTDKFLTLETDKNIIDSVNIESIKSDISKVIL